MEQNFTQEQLILHIYRETSPASSQSIEEAIRTDWKIREQYQELYKAYLTMPKAKFHPSKKSIDAILDYSRKQRMPVSV